MKGIKQWGRGESTFSSIETSCRNIYTHSNIRFSFLFLFWPCSRASGTRDWTWASAVKAPDHWTTREFPRVLHIFWIIPCQIHDLQTFSLSSFCFFDGIIYSTKVCNFHEVQFTYFSFVSFALSIIIKETLPNPRSLGFISVFSFLLF